MAASNTLRGKTLRGKTLILAAPSGGLEPAVLPMSGASGPSDQNLIQSTRYDNTQTYYTQSLTVGAVTLTAARYDNAQTFYAHVVYRQCRNRIYLKHQDMIILKHTILIH